MRWKTCLSSHMTNSFPVMRKGASSPYDLKTGNGHYRGDGGDDLFRPACGRPPSPKRSKSFPHFTTIVTFASRPFSAVTVITALPGFRPFTTPLALTFATFGAELVQA